MRRRSLLAGLLATPALAQGQPGYPDRPIRMVVPQPAGGATDIWARLIAEAMATWLGQPVVIENRGGAGGMIGTEAVKNAAPDGYTILFHITSFVQVPVVLKRWPYQPLTDFAPIGRMGTTPLPFCVREDMPVRSFAEFVRYAKGRRLNYGTYSPGSTGHAFAALVNEREQLEMQPVHYRGEAPMLQDMLSGQVNCAFHSMTGSGEHIRSGRLRPLATLGTSGIPSLPRVPTFLSLGYPPEFFSQAGFFGTWAPVATPAPIQAKLVEAFRYGMHRPDVVSKLTEMDTIVGYKGPAEFQQEIAEYLAFWTALAVRLNLSVEG